MCTHFSSNFDKVDNIDIVLKFPLSCRLPFLLMGTTFAIFHFSGQPPVLIDKFRILVRPGAKAVAPIRRSLGDIPSSPSALPSSRDVSLFRVGVGVERWGKVGIDQWG